MSDLILKLLLRLFPAKSARLASRILESQRMVDRLPPERALALAAALQRHESNREYDATLPWRMECYAQEGEDLLLARLFGAKTDGFYVDVGAHHAARFSNTFLLYRKGWRGINIDATPGSMKVFERMRPRDINIECLVAADDSPRPFYLLNESALNTVSTELAVEREKSNALYRVAEKIVLAPRRLSAILDQHLPKGQAIDLLTVDVEGSDLDVLRSNDWQAYRPAVILVELLDTTLDNLYQNEMVAYLGEKSYRPIAKLYNTVVFGEASIADGPNPT